MLDGNSLASLEDRATHPAVSVTENHRPEDLLAIEITIDTKTLSNEDLKANIDLAGTYKKTFAAELNGYNVQLSAYGNILLLPQTPVAEMEKARIATLNARDIIESKLEELSEKIDIFTQLLNQTREQLSLNEKQLADMSAAIPVDPSNRRIEKKSSIFG